MAEHKHGSMDIESHEKAFIGFVQFVKWGMIIAFGILIFLALVNA
jgi:hypothetical protein